MEPRRLAPHIALLVGVIALFIVAAYNQQLSHTSVDASCTGGTGSGSSLSGIYGWAWSDNIGWICFGTPACTAAGIRINSDSTLSGYGWSDNIGWIQFGGLDPATMPSGNGTQAVNAQVNGNNFKGWARALATNSNWDGWISLSGAGYGPIIPGGQGVSGPMSGYAWGSDVVGWVDFSQASLYAQNPIGSAFQPSFTATNRVAKGNPAYLSWSATCMASCSVRDQTGTLIPGSNTTSATNLATPPLMSPMQYILTCFDSNGAPNNATVNVGLVPQVREI